MPGIESVQPKQISTLGQPLVTDQAAVVTPLTVQPLMDAFEKQRQSAYGMMEQVANQPVKNAERAVAMQQASEMLAPEAIEARKTAVEAAGLQAQKAKQTLNSAEALAAFQRYHPIPLRGKDGNYDYDAMAEAGSNYMLAERQMSYAQAGLAVKPVTQQINGKLVTVYVNSFGEPIADENGKPNRYKAQYLQMRHEASKIFLKGPDWYSTTPGDIASPDDEGETEHPAATQAGHRPIIDASGVVAPAAGVFSREVAPTSILPTTAVPSTNQPVVAALPTEAVPVFSRLAALTGAGKPVVALGKPGNPFDAAASVAAFNSGGAPGAVPVVLPNAVPDQGTAAAAPMIQGQQPTTITTPDSHITVTPKAQPAPASQFPALVDTPLGPGYVTGWPEGGAPKDIVSTLRSTELYKNWAEKSGVMGRFNSLVADYGKKRADKVTTQDDIALANAVLQLQMPGGGGSGGRGSPEYRVTNLEESQPLLEQLLGIKGHILKTHKFEEGTRNRLIEKGREAITSLEGPVRGAIQTTRDKLASMGANPEEHLYPYELGVTGGTAGGESGAPRGRLITLPSGKKVFAE